MYAGETVMPDEGGVVESAPETANAAVCNAHTITAEATTK